MADFNYKIYFDGYESPTKEFEIDEDELEEKTPLEREDYARDMISIFMKDSLEITDVSYEGDEEFSFKLYHEGYDSPTKYLKIKESELEGKTEEEKEDYIHTQIFQYVINNLEATDIEEI